MTEMQLALVECKCILESIIGGVVLKGADEALIGALLEPVLLMNCFPIVEGDLDFH